MATTTGDFRDLRRRGCIYVGKTAHFHRLVTDAGANFFSVSRPRRLSDAAAERA